MTGLLRFTRNDKCVVERGVFLVIAREQRDRGDPVNNKVARMRAGINDWIASLRSQ